MKDFKGWYILSLEFGAYRKELRTCVMEIDGNGSRGIVGFRLLGRKTCWSEETDATGHTVWDRFSDVWLASVH